jgi:hypothetical protein
MEEKPTYREQSPGSAAGASSKVGMPTARQCETGGSVRAAPSSREILNTKPTLGLYFTFIVTAGPGIQAEVTTRLTDPIAASGGTTKFTW